MWAQATLLEKSRTCTLINPAVTHQDMSLGVPETGALTAGCH